jgi:hypothetical protein
MQEYIDNSPSVSSLDKGKKLIELLKSSNQKNEYFNVDLTLNFYVQ